MDSFVDTPEPPYRAVVFAALRAEPGPDDDRTARRMMELAREQPGFQGVESARAHGVDP